MSIFREDIHVYFLSDSCYKETYSLRSETRLKGYACVQAKVRTAALMQTPVFAMCEPSMRGDAQGLRPYEATGPSRGSNTSTALRALLSAADENQGLRCNASDDL